MNRVRLLKEGRAAPAGSVAHVYVAKASLPIIGLQCEIIDVIAAARQGSRDEDVVWR